MPKITEVKPVTIDNIHEIIPAYINEKQIIITSYEDMMEIVLQMIKEHHVFNMDRELLRSIMEDLTYMYCPGDDIYKERLILQLAPSDDEDDEDDDEDDDDDDDDDIPQIKVDTLVSDIED